MKSKHSLWICRECEKEYVPARKKFGSFVYLCDSCSYRYQFEDSDVDKDVGRTDRYVGRMTEKGNEGIEIFRTDIASHKKQILLESRRGFSPNIMITSPVNQLVREQKAEQKELDGEVKDSKSTQKKGDQKMDRKEELLNKVKEEVSQVYDRWTQGLICDQEFALHAVDRVYQVIQKELAK